jgi:uridine kinase
LKDCLYELVSNGSAYFPKYNFITGESIRRGKIMRFPENGIIIVEGIHALNPLLTEDAFIKNSIKLYVCVFTEFALGGRVLLTAHELRLTRRILRDCITRGITPEQSVDVWKHVLGGEEKYIKPFIGSADFVIDTTHDYEPLVYKKLIMPKLRNIVEAVPQNMLGDYEKFGEIDKNLIPADSMLNEFVVR